MTQAYITCCFTITSLKLSPISPFIFQELKNTEAAQSKVEAAQEQVFGQQGLTHIWKYIFKLTL